MTIATFPAVRDERTAVRVIARAALVVAVLDGLWAMLLWSAIRHVATPGQVWQGVARAVLGAAARDSGSAGVVLGLAMHVTVATTWSAVYYALLQRWPRFRAAAAGRGVVPIGMAYGAFVWLMMDLVVIPFTRTRQTPPGSTMFLVNLVAHTVVVGLPLALAMRSEAARGR